jgi:hydrogenase/urease accessory protein HupE
LNMNEALSFKSFDFVANHIEGLLILNLYCLPSLGNQLIKLVIGMGIQISQNNRPELSEVVNRESSILFESFSS